MSPTLKLARTLAAFTDLGTTADSISEIERSANGA